MEETEFALTERFFPNFRRLYLRWMVPLFLIILLAALFLGPSSPEPFLIAVMACVLGGIFSYTLWRTYHKQVESFRGYRIVLNESSIRRSQPGLLDIVIPRENVTRIVRTPGKGLAVTGRTRQQVLGIPETLEGFAVVENELESWRPFEARKSAVPAALTLLALAGVLANSAVLFTSTNRILVTACGGAFAALMIYSALSLPDSPHVEERAKKSFRWIYPLGILFVAVRLWMVWTR